MGADFAGSGYKCYTQTAFNFPGQACASIFPSIITTVVTVAENLQTTQATLYPLTEAVNGYGISIRYQASDLVSRTSSGSVSVSNSATSVPSSAPSSTSTGAKAAIVVGIVAVVLIALSAVAFSTRRRRRRGSLPACYLHSNGNMDKDSAILLKQNPYVPSSVPVELDGREMRQ